MDSQSKATVTKSWNLSCRHENQKGFSLLEVMIALGIILTLALALTSTLRSGLDMRETLSQRVQVTHRASVAMQRIVQDLQHAFFISELDLNRYGEKPKRKMKPIFRVHMRGGGDELFLTTSSFQPTLANQKQGDIGLVFYRLQTSHQNADRTHLYRGSFGRIPENFKEEPPMKLLAKHIKSIKIQPWRGDDWARSDWDTTGREYKNKLPHMVKVTLQAWSEDPPDETIPGVERLDESKIPLYTLDTVVYLPTSLAFDELKQRTKSVRWDRF